MKKAYLHMVKYALADGKLISVGSEGEMDLYRSNKYTEIKETIEAVEVADVFIRDAEGGKYGRALIVPGNTEPEETLADYSVTEWMEAWWANYKATR